MTRIVKYNYGLWDADRHTGFINIFDKNFYICSRWKDSKLVEVVQLPENSHEFFLVWYDKLTRQGCSPVWSVDLIKDFWLETEGGGLILEDLEIEIKGNGDRIRQLNGEWLENRAPKIKIENFEHLSLLGI